MSYKNICEKILSKMNFLLSCNLNLIPECVILGEKYFNILNKDFCEILNTNITEIYGLKIIIDKENKERISVGI